MSNFIGTFPKFILVRMYQTQLANITVTVCAQTLIVLGDGVSGAAVVESLAKCDETITKSDGHGVQYLL